MCKWLGVPPDEDQLEWDTYARAVACMTAEAEAEKLVRDKLKPKAGNRK